MFKLSYLEWKTSGVRVRLFGVWDIHAVMRQRWKSFPLWRHGIEKQNKNILKNLIQQLLDFPNTMSR